MAVSVRGETAPSRPSNDSSACVAVMSSFPEELAAIESTMGIDRANVETESINGVDFKSVQIGGKHFLFFMTGMSLVNAAMNTQLALDHFHVRAVYFTGIAGGIDPAFGPGDVVIPERWHYHAEEAYVNEISPGHYVLPDYLKPHYKNFGMMFPDDVWVKREGMADWQQVAAFPADDALLADARKATESMPPLKLGDHVCKLRIGGDGVSGTVFCDNADYRKWVFDVWKAECLDMESAAIAHVCWQNKTPCLIVRGLSDLAGGQAGKNQEEQYLNAAAANSARVLTTILQH